MSLTLERDGPNSITHLTTSDEGLLFKMRDYLRDQIDIHIVVISENGMYSANIACEWNNLIDICRTIFTERSYSETKATYIRKDAQEG